MYDKKIKTMHMNPGAIGDFGIHQVKTVLWFTIDGKYINKNVYATTRLFNQNYGMGFSRWKQKLRILKSLELLNSNSQLVDAVDLRQFLLCTSAR